jgi:hypothetical protein
MFFRLTRLNKNQTARQLLPSFPMTFEERGKEPADTAILFFIGYR